MPQTQCSTVVVSMNPRGRFLDEHILQVPPVVELTSVSEPAAFPEVASGVIEL
jgi:hypothetical protein